MGLPAFFRFGLLTIATAVSCCAQNGPTITLFASQNPVPLGQRVDIEVIVKASDFVPTGFVTLRDGNTDLGSVLLTVEDDGSHGIFSTSKLASGTHFIIAIFGGNDPSMSAMSQPLVLVVGRRSTVTTLSATPSPANAGQTVTFQVQVLSDSGMPTGSVTLTENSTTLGMATLNASGVATITLSNLTAGTHSIVASFGGDANFDVSSSTPFTLQVNGTATTTQLTAAPNPVQAGQNVTLTAAVKSSSGVPSGTVTFQNAQGSLGTATLDSTGQATLTVSFQAPGTQTLTASFAASGPFAASASAAVTLTVTPRQVTITSAASFVTVVSPDSLATIFGDHLAAMPVTAGPLPWPFTLGGVQVVFKDSTGTERLAALQYVSSMQINAVVPADLPVGQIMVIVRGGGVDLETGTATVANVAPALFAGDGTGKGAAAAAVEVVHPDGSTSLQQAFRCDSNGNCTTTSLNLGSDGDQAVLILFGTGIRRGSQTAKVRINGQDLTPSYAAAQPQYGGVDQVNVTLPVSLRGAGDVTVQIVIGDQLSNVVMLHFQ